MPAGGGADAVPALRDERKRSRLREKELRRKERALAEAAALLVLSRKLDAFRTEGEVRADARSDAERCEPAHKLTEAERERMVAVCHEARFADLPPRWSLRRRQGTADHVTPAEAGVQTILDFPDSPRFRNPTPRAMMGSTD